MSFDDPVVRCMECQLMIFREELRAAGCCPKCGNRRVRNVLVMQPDERDKLRLAGHEKFLARFEEVS